MQILKALRTATASLIISLGLITAAHATVILPTMANSVYNSGTNVSPMYAGDTGQGQITRLYEKFVLPTFLAGTAITSAYFYITETTRFNNASDSLGLFQVVNDSWNTSTNWANKPALDTIVGGFNQGMNTVILGFDITSFINSQYLGDGIASLAIASFNEGMGKNSWSYFSSPKLDFTISTVASVPEPGTIALLGLGLLGFAAARRHRKSAR